MVELSEPLHRAEDICLAPGAVSYSILSARALGEFVTEAYRLPQPFTCSLLRRGLQDKYLLHAGGHRYLVRVDRFRQRSAAEVSYECDLLKHLASKGVPVSVPLTASHGTCVLSVSAPEGPRPLVLFPYASAPPLAWTDVDQCRLAGRLLATIHGAADDFSSVHARTALSVPSVVDSPLAALRPFLAHRAADWKYLEALGGRLRARLVAAANRGVDCGPCHGDFVATNIHLLPNGGLSVVGFDRCGPHWRASDFVGIWWVSPNGAASSGWNAFVDGYTACRPFDAHQLSLVPVCRACRHLSDVALFAINAEQWGTSKIGDRQIDDWLALFRRWELDDSLGADVEGKAV